MKYIEPKEIKKMMDNGYRLIDIREDWEWEKGIIEGAEKITMNDIKNDSRILGDKNDKYILYCRSGIRSENTCEFIINDGFTNVINLDGGYKRYKSEMNK